MYKLFREEELNVEGKGKNITRKTAQSRKRGWMWYLLEPYWGPEVILKLSGKLAGSTPNGLDAVY